MTPEEIQRIEESLDALLDNSALPPAADALPEGIRGRLARLCEHVGQAEAFALKLSAGDMNAEPPPRTNRISAGLKQLQAQMLHLTWQTQRVAQGDYLQRVDYMGEFSAAFNEMVDQLHRREQSLRRQQRVMEHIFNLIEPIVVVSQVEGRPLYANMMATLRLGIQPGDGVPPETARRLYALQPSQREQELYDPDGMRWYSVAVHAIQWNDEQDARLYYCRDITAHKQRETRLDLEANTDKLTGLNNRRAFDRALGMHWVACREAHKPLSVIIFDIDLFKQINDKHGHLEGDKVLIAFSGILRQCISRADDVVARFGGEEFIAALPFTSLNNAVDIANEVCEMTQKQIVHLCGTDGRLVGVRFAVSGGVSSAVPTPDLDPTQLILGADQALYEAKQTGRGRVCCAWSVPSIPASGLPKPGNEGPQAPGPAGL